MRRTSRPANWRCATCGLFSHSQTRSELSMQIIRLVESVSGNAWWLCRRWQRLWHPRRCEQICQEACCIERFLGLKKCCSLSSGGSQSTSRNFQPPPDGGIQVRA